MFRRRTLVAVLATLLLHAVPPALSAQETPAYQPSRDAALALGRQTTRLAFSNQVDSLIVTADPATGDSDSLRKRLDEAMPQIAMQLGAERRVIDEKIMRVNGRIEYWRTAEYELVPIPLVFRVLMGDEGKWRGFNAMPESEMPSGEEVLP